MKTHNLVFRQEWIERRWLKDNIPLQPDAAAMYPETRSLRYSAVMMLFKEVGSIVACAGRREYIAKMGQLEHLLGAWMANEEVLLRRRSELREEREETYEGRGYSQNDSSQNEAEMEDGPGHGGGEPNEEQSRGGQEQYGEDDYSGENRYGGEGQAPTESDSHVGEEGLGSANEDLNDIWSNSEGSNQNTQDDNRDNQEGDGYNTDQNTQDDNGNYQEGDGYYTDHNTNDTNGDYQEGDGYYTDQNTQDTNGDYEEGDRYYTDHNTNDTNGDYQEGDGYYTDQYTQDTNGDYGEGFGQNEGDGVGEEWEGNNGFDGTNVPPYEDGEENNSEGDAEVGAGANSDGSAAAQPMTDEEGRRGKRCFGGNIYRASGGNRDDTEPKFTLPPKKTKNPPEKNKRKGKGQGKKGKGRASSEADTEQMMNEEDSTPLLDRQLLEYVRLLNKTDILEVIHTVTFIDLPPMRTQGDVDLLRSRSPVRRLEGELRTKGLQPQMMAAYAAVIMTFKKELNERTRDLSRQRDIGNMLAIVLTYAMTYNENVQDVVPLIQPVPTDGTIKVEQLVWCLPGRDATQYRCNNTLLSGMDLHDLHDGRSLNDNVSFLLEGF